MILPGIKNVSLDGKRVLMRVDFNVLFKDGSPQEAYKIISAKKSIDFVISQKGVKLALLSHLGRPKDKERAFSFENFYLKIGEILEKSLVFVDDCVGEKVAIALEELKDEQVLMLENARFYKEDMEGDENFTDKLAENFDIYINESFGVNHRSHASLTEIISRLPSYVGFNFQKEIDVLSKSRESFSNPSVAIIGGAKIKTKIPVIKFFAEKYDIVLVAGRLGIEAEKENIVFSENVILPKDYEGGGKDVGQKTIDEFCEYISKAKTIVWNGPLGMFEVPPYHIATEKVLDAILQNKDAFKVGGGGETVQVLEERGVIEEFDFVSTGGGAMLEFLAKGTLPVIEAFLNKK